MKFFERILIKLTIIQLVFLLGTQIVIHQFNLFPSLKIITKYEGVHNDNISDVIETFFNDRK